MITEIMRDQFTPFLPLMAEVECGYFGVFRGQTT